MIGAARLPLLEAHRLALHAIARVGNGALVGALGQTYALHADREPRLVHHDEHVFEAAVFLADQIADRTALVAVREHRRRARVNPELVLERHAMHVVARSDRTVGVDQELRHDEKGDTLDTFRRRRRSREHQMDDVLGVVVLAVGDEDLLPEQLVGAVALRHGARAHRGKVGPGLRLGQVHRARPRAFDHLRQVRRLLFGRAAQLQRVDCALCQQRAQIERHVRRMPHLLHRRGNEMWQPLAAIFRTLGESVPAVLDRTACTRP